MEGFARFSPFGGGRGTIVNLTTLKEGNRLPVPNDGNDKFAQTCVATVAKCLRTATRIKKFGLIAHGAQFRAAGAFLERAAKWLRASFALEDDRALPIHRDERRINPESPPGKIEKSPKTGQGGKLVK